MKVLLDESKQVANELQLSKDETKNAGAMSLMPNILSGSRTRFPILSLGELGVQK